MKDYDGFMVVVEKYESDADTVELSLRVIAKLNDLTDREFVEMEFVAAE